MLTDSNLIGAKTALFIFQAEILTGIPIKCVDDAKHLLPVLLDKGCGCVIVTMGSNGSVFATQNNKTPCHVPTDKVNPVDTTVSATV